MQPPGIGERVSETLDVRDDGFVYRWPEGWWAGIASLWCGDNNRPRFNETETITVDQSLARADRTVAGKASYAANGEPP